MKRDKNRIAVDTYEKIAGVYTKTYFDDKSDFSFIDKFLAYLKPKSKVLDVGSGPGQFTKYMTEKGFEVTGIDLTKSMLAIAKKRVPQATFRHMDMRKLEFKKDSFDGLLIAYSLIHIPSSEVIDTLKGFNHVTQPGGYILLITQRGKVDQIIDEPFSPGNKMFINFFTKKKLVDSLHRAGFEKVFQEEVNTSDSLSLSNKIIYTIARQSRAF